MNPSFEQLYQQLSEKHRPQLEEIRKSIIPKLWLAWAICTSATFLVLLVVFSIGRFAVFLDGGDEFADLNRMIIVSAIMAILFSPLMVYVLKGSVKRPYVLYFRENVARSFVTLIDPSLTYLPQPADDWEYRPFAQNADNWFSWILDRYNAAGFSGWVDKDKGIVQATMPCDTSSSPGLSNLIIGEIEGRPFRLCCMSLTFKGMFVYMEVSKSLNGYIKVARKPRGLASLTREQLFVPKAERKKMDSAAFEKDFFVGSNDQITAMLYLTADIMELLINFKNELIDVQTRFSRNLLPQNPNDINLDFLWQGNKVLMRIGNKKMFKPTLRDPMCKDSLACCLSSLRFATRLNHAITKSIKETAI